MNVRVTRRELQRLHTRLKIAQAAIEEVADWLEEQGDLHAADRLQLFAVNDVETARWKVEQAVRKEND